MWAVFLSNDTTFRPIYSHETIPLNSESWQSMYNKSLSKNISEIVREDMFHNNNFMKLKFGENYFLPKLIVGKFFSWWKLFLSYRMQNLDPGFENNADQCKSGSIQIRIHTDPVPCRSGYMLIRIHEDSDREMFRNF